MNGYRGARGDGRNGNDSGVGVDGTSATAVVFLSFLRDWAFWRDGARRIVRGYFFFHCAWEICSPFSPHSFFFWLFSGMDHKISCDFICAQHGDT